METIRIDGAIGEGGGQILRTSLTLAILKKVKIEIYNIRAKRDNPGLLRQHLTCVRAAKEICNAQVEGDELGSKRIVFEPGEVVAGNYHFSVGTAGSTALVCQTILLPLAMADGESRITFEGGTHNSMAPSAMFLQQSFFPVLQKMGLNTEVKLEQFGFYPAGGGKWTLWLQPLDTLKPLELDKIHAVSDKLTENVYVTSIISKLAESIAEREIEAVVKELGGTPLSNKVLKVPSAGPGNMLSVRLEQEEHTSVFEMVGMIGVSAERIAKRVTGRLKHLIKAKAMVEEHLADQLLLPMLLAGKGAFTTTKPSLHTTTNIDVIEKITGTSIDCSSVDDKLWRISLS